MSDREFNSSEDLSLPKATVQKIVSEILGENSGLTCSKEARDLIIDCCVEFVTLISSEANEIAEKEAKKTIGPDHIEKALRDLGFPEYVQEVLASAGEHKEQLRTREKRVHKPDTGGLSNEELERIQRELFASASEKYNAGPEAS